jgi:hypothetical protein
VSWAIWRPSSASRPNRWQATSPTCCPRWSIN